MNSVKNIILILSFIFVYSFSCAQTTDQTSQTGQTSTQASMDIKTLLSSSGKVLYGDEPNSIQVIDYPENIQRVAEYLDTLDIAPRQVLIEARVVEVKLQGESSLGVNWNLFAHKGFFPLGGRFKAGTSSLGVPPGQLTQTIPYKPTFFPPAQITQGQETPFTFSIFSDNINIVLQMLANTLDTSILSAPRITTVNNHQAQIKVIESLPWAEPQVTVSDTGTVTVTWTINFAQVGITLKVTPTINEDGTIAMQLDPDVSEKVSDYSLTVTQGTTSVPYTVPIIDSRTASTKVVVGSGQTLIIGGLIKDKVTKGETKIPLLGDLPFFGYLFKSSKDIKDKTELLIFVSPTVITPNELVHMAREEKFGLSKKYAEQDRKNNKETVMAEAEAKAKNDKLAAQLRLLEDKQNSLVETRKKLEADIIKEEEKFRALGENQDAAIQK